MYKNGNSIQYEASENDGTEESDSELLPMALIFFVSL